ncbi:hypothetical protein SOVF_077180 [Spinacia oleracea]|nr:hypothetical protein SOVF_077180 [Spinacia oleracea]
MRCSNELKMVDSDCHLHNFYPSQGFHSFSAWKILLQQGREQQMDGYTGARFPSFTSPLLHFSRAIYPRKRTKNAASIHKGFINLHSLGVVRSRSEYAVLSRTCIYLQAEFRYQCIGTYALTESMFPLLEKAAPDSQLDVNVFRC